LKTLALEPMHGWAISHRIRAVSKEVLQVNQGALYPALHRLEQNGWIKAEWGESENNRKAKYYSLTRAGRKYMEKEEANWERVAAIDWFLNSQLMRKRSHSLPLSPCTSSLPESASSTWLCGCSRTRPTPL